MENNDFLNLVDRTFANCLELMIKKGKEYAGDEDRLANFKEIGEELGISPEKVCIVYLEKHMRAIKSCERNRALSEETETRVLDCINYLLLLQALQFEKIEQEMDSQLIVPKSVMDAVIKEANSKEWEDRHIFDRT